MEWGIEEMTQCVRVFAALTDDSASVHSTYVVVHSHLQPQFQGISYLLLVSKDAA